MYRHIKLKIKQKWRRQHLFKGAFLQFFFSRPLPHLTTFLLCFALGATCEWAFSLRCCVGLSWRLAMWPARPWASSRTWWLRCWTSTPTQSSASTSTLWTPPSSPSLLLTRRWEKRAQTRKNDSTVFTCPLLWLCSSFLSIYMRMQCMCAPWRTALYSCTKASQRTPSQHWWVLCMSAFVRF